MNKNDTNFSVQQIILKLLTFFIKQGKKSVVRKSLNFVFLKLSLMFKTSIFLILAKFFSKLNTFVETRTISIKRSRYVVPFPISFNRRIYLIVKWLIQSLKKNKKKISFSYKVIKEISFVLKGEKSEVLDLKRLNLSRALVNRSNAHYRW